MSRYKKLEGQTYPMEGFQSLLLRVDISQKLALSDFYAKLYTLLGEPNVTRFEGYSYLIEDTETGAVFLAELTGFGQGYTGKPGELASIQAFEAFRQAQVPVDCRFEYAHDFGKTILGAKDGQPFELHFEE